MALLTLGTTAQTTLKAIQWNSALLATAAGGINSISDLAALNALIKTQKERAILPPATFQPIPAINQGVLYTQRGALRLIEGDFIGVDPVTGDVIVLQAVSAAGASWVHT